MREGETVVIGIQNSPGSTLMTLADMAIITAEVRVDETDIVNVRLGQPAEVTIDAIPKKSFKAVVTEIGNNAIVRSTGVSTSQQTSRQPGSEGLQSGRDLAGTAAELASGSFSHREDHDRFAKQCAGRFPFRHWPSGPRKTWKQSLGQEKLGASSCCGRLQDSGEEQR